MKVAIDVPEARVLDLLCCAFEGGIGYWAEVKQVHGQWNAYYQWQIPMQRGCQLEIGDATGEGFPSKNRAMLNRSSIHCGLQTMASKYPAHWANFVAENEDAETGDVFVQCCLFGEVVFG